MTTPAVAASAPLLSGAALSFTEPTGTQVVLTITAAIVSGLLALGLSTWHMRRFEARKIKYDTLKKFAANRYDLKGDEFTRAINEIFIVFNRSAPVMSALAAFHRTTVLHGATNDELVILFKAMCIDLGVNYAQFNDSYFLQPFNVKESSKSAA
jgi:hypothetical protein